MTTLTVGIGQQYQTIAAAVAASQDGDVIQIQAGTYTNDFAEITKKITLEGVGGMAKLVATQPIPNGKAILITDTDVTIDHLEFTGASVADGNGAGIRYQGGNLTITNSSFHDNQEGLLSADDLNGSITIENSDFSNNGTGTGYTHNLYVGDIKQLTVDNSYFSGAIVGHEIKSRAENTTITNSRIQDLPGDTASYEIDLPNGGNAVIANNVIEQSAASQNPIIISYGEEGSLRANSSLTVTGNTIINDLASSSATAVRNATSVSATVANNKVYGLSSSQILSGSGTVAGLTTLATEPVLNLTSAILAAAGSTSSSSSGSSSSGSSTGSTSSGSSTSGTTTTNPTTGLVLDISEDAWQSDAQYTISVDGQQVGGTRTATAAHGAGSTQPVLVASSLGAGTHTVTVNFLNDAYGGTASTDRNLYVDTALLNGQTIAGSALTLMGGGPASFTVTVPSTSTSTGSTSTGSTGTGSTTTGSTGSTTTGTTTSNTSGLVLKISEDAWQGDAQYTISVDGQQVGGTRTATASHAAGQSQAVTVDTTLSPGQHTVAVTFLNDAYGGTASTDRNLYIDTATLNGQTIAGSTQAQMGNGTSSFTITVPPTTTTTTTPTPNVLAVKISEDAWKGNAQYTVALDGKQVGGTRTATASHAAGQSLSSIISSALTAGSHSLAVTFLNDAYGGTASTDRNLYVDGATLNGQSIPGSTVAMLGNGTSTINFIVPAS